MKYTLFALGFLLIILILNFPNTLFAQELGPDVGGTVKVAPFIDESIQGEPLNYLVNSPYKELGPMPTKDGRRLYFSRQGHPENIGGQYDEDIWYSEFVDVSQSWSKAVNIGPPLSSKGPNFVTGVGNNGDTLLLGNEYGKHGRMKAGVSISVKVGNLWSYPVPIKIEGDYNFSGRASYDLSHDRNTMIIAQEKADSQGKLDLYVTFRDPNSTYPYAGVESINLGSVINTFGNETSPWLAYDGATLYFASDGHNGYGGLDIFVSKRLDNSWTNWSEPFNLGSGINSPYDDLSFNYNPRSRYAYFSRGLTSENSDIYRVDMTYLFKNMNTPLSYLKLGEDPVQIGETKIVNDVFNDSEHLINPSSYEDLDDIVGYLKKFPEMLILITTHSNKHADRRESLTLSNQRAINVVHYFVEKGIAEKRFSYQGMGHDVLVNTSGSIVRPGVKIASMVEFKLIGFNKSSLKN